MADGSELGFGAGGVADALQLYQSLQTGDLDNQQKQIKLQSSQMELDNMKKLQSSLASGQFDGINSKDPTEHTDALTKLANTYLSDGFPEQASQISTMANTTAKTQADILSKEANDTLSYIDLANKTFAGVTTPEEWHAAQTVVQSELPPEMMKNPTIKSLLTSAYDPNKVKILPQFLDYLKTRAQAKLDNASALKDNAETKTQEVDQRVKEEQINLDKTREKYLQKTGAFDEDAEGDSTGDKLSQLRYLVAKDQIPLPLGTRSLAARNQFFADAIKNNPKSSAEEIVADMKSGYIGMKGDLTEAGVIARREGNIEAAQAALTESGGLFEQLDATAKQVNFGDSKTVSQVRTAMQKHVYANPQIQAYATTLEDTRADLATVLSRSGQTTDHAREQATASLPDTMSYPELQAAVGASRKVVDAVQRGNKTVMEALKAGKSIQEALAADKPKVFTTQAAAQAARKAGNLHDGDKITINGVSGTWKD